MCNNIPMELVLGLFLGTFILEDVALASACLFLAKGKMSLHAAFIACFLGISIGDILLYGVGRFSLAYPKIKSWPPVKRALKTFSRPEVLSKWDFAVVISRALPGTRIPTYIGSGLIQFPLWRFIALTLISVAIWVSVSLSLGSSVQQLLIHHPFVGLGSIFVFLWVIKKVVFYSTKTWERKALLYRWRAWTHYEFWPAWLFYIPVIPFYIYHSLRTGSFFHPFYANPTILNAGLVGESKWDFLKHVVPTAPSTLPSGLLKKGASVQESVQMIAELNIDYPVVLKPDVGQRGFGVRIIRNVEELSSYVKNADFDIIVQKKSQYEKEAGIFYLRNPQQKEGRLFSITLKGFPSVLGNGKDCLGDLILRDERARIIASVYFARHAERLNAVVPQGHAYTLSECGNHCQGAIFYNGAQLMTPELLKAVDAIAQTIPHFYFGRLDVRYRSDVELVAGEKFEIVEVNGAGAEATHIWDANEKLISTYRTLFQQWGHLFDIGKAVRHEFPELKSASLFRLVKDFFSLLARKHPLAVSS